MAGSVCDATIYSFYMHIPTNNVNIIICSVKYQIKTYLLNVHL